MEKPGLIVTTGPCGQFGPTGGRLGQYGNPEMTTKFLLGQFHFHWSPPDGVSGEHRIRAETVLFKQLKGNATSFPHFRHNFIQVKKSFSQIKKRKTN